MRMRNERYESTGEVRRIIRRKMDSGDFWMVVVCNEATRLLASRAHDKFYSDAGDDEVMTVELPLPGIGGVWVAAKARMSGPEFYRLLGDRSMDEEEFCRSDVVTRIESPIEEFGCALLASWLGGED